MHDRRGSCASINPRASTAAAMNASARVRWSAQHVRSCTSNLAQALAGHELEDHVVRDAVILVEFQQVDDVRIVGLGHEPRLFAEPPEDLGIVDPVRPQDLDRDDQAIGRILRAMDDALASLTQLFQQAIPAQARDALFED